jgi:hypothetical protein
VLVWCLNSASIGLAWCWYETRRFLYMWSLVLAEIDDADIPAFRHQIANNESAPCQLGQERININVVLIGEQLAAYSQRPVLEPAFPISEQPESGEQEAGAQRALRQFVIGKEPRLQNARSRHLPAFLQQS